MSKITANSTTDQYSIFTLLYFILLYCHCGNTDPCRVVFTCVNLYRVPFITFSRLSCKQFSWLSLSVQRKHAKIIIQAEELVVCYVFQLFPEMHWSRNLEKCLLILKCVFFFACWNCLKNYFIKTSCIYVQISSIFNI